MIGRVRRRGRVGGLLRVLLREVRRVSGGGRGDGDVRKERVGLLVSELMGRLIFVS